MGHQSKLGHLSPALLVGEVEKVRVQGGSSLHPQMLPRERWHGLPCWADCTVLLINIISNQILHTIILISMGKRGFHPSPEKLLFVLDDEITQRAPTDQVTEN